MAVIALLALSAGVGVGALRHQYANDKALQNRVLVQLPEPKSLVAFALDGRAGQQVNLPLLRGKWTFLFFGYTHCPDVCPTTLAEIAQVRQLLLKANVANDAQFVFITVDPKRDTAKRLSDYAAFFDPHFLAARGTDEQIRNLAQQVGAAYYKESATQDGKNYSMGHSSAIFLIDPEARLAGLFTAPHTPNAISIAFQEIHRSWTP